MATLRARTAASRTATGAAACEVTTVWQSTLYAPESLPMPPDKVPDTFTAFRHKLEASGAAEAQPLPAVTAWPSAPAEMRLASPTHLSVQAGPLVPDAAPVPTPAHWPRQPGGCTFPPPNGTSDTPTVASHGGEPAALAHLANYCAQGLPHSYKATRNALTGFDHASRWSPWLASGALSARQAMAAIRQFEATQGATDSTYWL